MPLPVLQGIAARSNDDLVRLFHRTELHWSRHLGEEAPLDAGVAISNPDLPKVWNANRVLDAAAAEQRGRGGEPRERALALARRRHRADVGEEDRRVQERKGRLLEPRLDPLTRLHADPQRVHPSVALERAALP